MHVAAQMLFILVVATTIFDVIHWMLHRLDSSTVPLLRWLGRLHRAHHEFLDAELRLHDAVTKRNIVCHVLPELATRLAVSSALLTVLDPLPVLVTMGLFVAATIGVVFQRGRDFYHRDGGALRAWPNPFFVDAAYHALHHRHPDRYFSSSFQVFDKLAGTACHLRGRRVTVTGASGAFGAPLVEMLEREQASVQQLRFGVDWSYAIVDVDRVDDRVDAILRDTDILVLAHGSKVKDAMDANCTSFVSFIERYKRARASRGGTVDLPEVWAIGSEIETHPSFGIPSLRAYLESKRAYARHARRYARDAALVYRHIVPSAFTSAMGPGLLSGRQAARIALFLIKRGLRYVPVTYTGFAFIGFAKFLFRIDVAAHGVRS